MTEAQTTPDEKMRRRKVAETTKVEQPKTKAVKETVVKEKPAAVEKKPKVEKIKLQVTVPKGVTVVDKKFIVTASSDENKKKRIWVRGKVVGLTEKVSGLANFKSISEEDAKKNHLGKTRMLGKVSTQEELDQVIGKFFA